MSGLTLDRGALIAFDGNDRKLVGVPARALELGYELAVPAAVVAQAWRAKCRQARLARLLGANDVEVEALDDLRSREAGQLCGVKDTAGVIDASVVLCARARGHVIITSDPSDIRRLDPAARIVSV